MDAAIMFGLVLGLPFFLVMGVWAYRIEATHRLCVAMLGTIHELNLRDIDDGCWATSWRYAAFDSVDSDEMVKRFWLPLRPESFYPDLSFLDPDVTQPPV